jgi:hypothetical protein
METFIGFTAVAVTTIVALFGALALQALLLHAVVALMQPAAAPRRSSELLMGCGTQLATRACVKAR